MAEIVTGDRSKGIKYVGELALRISRFDSYRLFTLYENAQEKKPMDVSGNQKYYLVFKSPSKEIRIPEYEPNGFFEVDKVNGCILFKITKKNAEDILGLKTGGKRIFHIVRTYEETDEFGRVLSVTDEVEVYHGRWGDDDEFSEFTTEAKVDLLTKSLATQIDKYNKLLSDFEQLLGKYNEEVEKSSSLEKEMESLRAEVQSLQTQLNEYTGNTYDGTILSTDTKYIAFENTLENLTFTEDQYKSALGELLTNGSVDLTSDVYDGDIIEEEDTTINLNVSVKNKNNNTKITVYRNNIEIGSAVYGQDFSDEFIVTNNTIFKFVCTGGKINNRLHLNYLNDSKDGFNGAFTISKSSELVSVKGEATLYATSNFCRFDGEHAGTIYAVGNLGSLNCCVI